jgi:hypothetical protein
MGFAGCQDGGLMQAATEASPRRFADSKKAPIDRSVEDPCFVVAGWPLFEDEISDVAAIVGCRPSALKRSPGAPLSMWRRLGGPVPVISRSLDARLAAALMFSAGRNLVDYIDPVAWVARDGVSPFVYGSKHFIDSTNSVRKGGVRTARFIGEDESKINERFVAQCLQDFCSDGTLVRLCSVHGYDGLRIADNGPRDPQLPDFEGTCDLGCDLCSDGWFGNFQVQTTWRKLFHRAEQFLAEWELVRINVSGEWSGPDLRYGDLDGWPLGEP